MLIRFGPGHAMPVDLNIEHLIRGIKVYFDFSNEHYLSQCDVEIGQQARYVDWPTLDHVSSSLRLSRPASAKHFKVLIEVLCVLLPKRPLL